MVALASLSASNEQKALRIHTIRLWDVKTDAESARLEIDAPVCCLVTFSAARFVAGDRRLNRRRPKSAKARSREKCGTRQRNERYEDRMPAPLSMVSAPRVSVGPPHLHDFPRAIA
jgi:hypothetical protein